VGKAARPKACCTEDNTNIGQRHKVNQASGGIRTQGPVFQRTVTVHTSDLDIPEDTILQMSTSLPCRFIPLGDSPWYPFVRLFGLRASLDDMEG
jgi:hypothetical protein